MSDVNHFLVLRFVILSLLKLLFVVNNAFFSGAQTVARSVL